MKKKRVTSTHASERASDTRVCALAEGTPLTRSHNRSLRQRLDKDKKGGKPNQRDGPHQPAWLLCTHRLGEQLHRDCHAYPLTNGDQEVRKVQHRSPICQLVEGRTPRLAHKRLLESFGDLHEQCRR